MDTPLPGPDLPLSGQNGEKQAQQEKLSAEQRGAWCPVTECAEDRAAAESEGARETGPAPLWARLPVCRAVGRLSACEAAGRLVPAGCVRSCSWSDQWKAQPCSPGTSRRPVTRAPLAARLLPALCSPVTQASPLRPARRPRFSPGVKAEKASQCPRL